MTKNPTVQPSKNIIILGMRAKKAYTLMELVAKHKVTRQYVNFILNQGINNKQIKREGSRKHYTYTKIGK